MKKLRTCIIPALDKMGLFHKWSERSRVIEPSPMIGGHSGGIVKFQIALVEMEDGSIQEFLPSEIKFTDRI